MVSTRTHHFDLSQYDDQGPLLCHVGQRRFALHRHTIDSRREYRWDNTALRGIPDAQLTHFAFEVPVPHAAPQLLKVCPEVDPERVLLLHVRAPEPSFERYVEECVGQDHPHGSIASPRLARVGLVATMVSDTSIVLDAEAWTGTTDTAVALAALRCLHPAETHPCRVLGHVERAAFLRQLDTRLRECMRADLDWGLMDQGALDLDATVEFLVRRVIRSVMQEDLQLPMARPRRPVQSANMQEHDCAGVR